MGFGLFLFCVFVVVGVLGCLFDFMFGWVWFCGFCFFGWWFWVWLVLVWFWFYWCVVFWGLVLELLSGVGSHLCIKSYSCIEYNSRANVICYLGGVVLLLWRSF